MEEKQKDTPKNLKVSEHLKKNEEFYLVGVVVLSGVVLGVTGYSRQKEEENFIKNESLSKVISKYTSRTESNTFDDDVIDRINLENGPKTFLPGEHYIIKKIPFDNSGDQIPNDYEGYELSGVTVKNGSWGSSSYMMFTYVNEEEVEAYATSIDFVGSSQKSGNEERSIVYGDFGTVKEKSLAAEVPLQYKKVN